MKYCLLTLFVFSFVMANAQDSSRVNTADMRLLYPVLWQQTASEYRALCYQAYNTASLRLQLLPRKIKRKKNLAIITDIDETVLDNSYMQAQLIKNNAFYTDAFWKQWVNKSAATTVPGAVEFLQMASKKGIQIFYISNRDTASVAVTLSNLKQYNFPDADMAHLLFRSNTSSKEIRRQTVMQKHDVLMLLGDNLADFTSLFEQKNIDDRFAETDKAREEWGKRFIVLPNPVYGDWEGAFYNNQHGLTEAQKQTILLQLLKGFMP